MRSWGLAGALALVLTACGSTAAVVAPPEVLGVEATTESAIAPPPATFVGAPAVAPPAVLPPGPSAGGVWAVLVGIDDYPGRGHDLRSAGNDADDVDLALARAGVPADRRLHLRDGQATGAVLGHALDWLVDRAGPDATAVFFFAGHVRRLAPGTEALVGADGGLVADAEVARRLAGLRARRSWIVVAGCFGGGFTEVLAPGRILTAAAPAGRLAFESLELRRSYLVEYVVRRGLLAGAPSVERAFADGSAAIQRDHPGRAPVQFDALDGDLVLGAPTPESPVVPPPSATRPTVLPQARSAPPPTTSTTRPGAEREGCGFTMGTLVHCPG